jgi:hypothetical protein
LNWFNNKYDQDLCLAGNGKIERVVDSIERHWRKVGWGEDSFDQFGLSKLKTSFGRR